MFGYMFVLKIRNEIFDRSKIEKCSQVVVYDMLAVQNGVNTFPKP